MANRLGYQINTKRCQDSIDNYSRLITPEYLAKYKEDETVQVSFEREFDRYLNPCSGRTASVVKRLSDLDFGKLKSDLSDKFYNHTVLKTLECAIKAIAKPFGDVTPESTRYVKKIEAKIVDYFANLKQIGGVSAYGFAMSGSIRTGNDIIVVKSPRNPEGSAELRHEWAVGALAINNLRKIIPNFSYVLGGYDCNPPFIVDRMAMRMCQKDSNKVAHVIYENVSPAETFGGYSKKCSASDFLMYYLQTLLAINVAQKAYGFCHNDAHGDNVLLRDTGKESYIPYDYKGQTVYIKSGGLVATFIDYGMSRVVVKDQKGRAVNIGILNPRFITHGTFRDRLNPLQDAYKLLMSCLYSMMISGNQERYKLKFLFEFFNTTEDMDSALNSQRSMFFFYPLTAVSIKLTVEDYIDYIFSNMSRYGFVNPVSKTPEGVVFSCRYTNLGETLPANDVYAKHNSKQCKPVNVEKYGISKSLGRPNKYSEFNDVYAQLSREREYIKNNIPKLYSEGDLRRKDLILKKYTDNVLSVNRNILRNEVDILKSYTGIVDISSSKFTSTKNLNPLSTQSLSVSKENSYYAAMVFDVYDDILKSRVYYEYAYKTLKVPKIRELVQYVDDLIPKAKAKKESIREFIKSELYHLIGRADVVQAMQKSGVREYDFYFNDYQTLIAS